MKINWQILSFERNARTSQRAWFLLQRLYFKLDSELYSELEKEIEKSAMQWFCITQNSIKNNLIYILIQRNKETLDSRDKYENYFYTLSKKYGFWDEYISALSKKISDKKIKNTTKRNLFLSLFLR